MVPLKGQPQFLTSVADAQNLPAHDYREVVFFGASNVGKSSLINSLCNQKSLAKTSKTPGRTQLLNFFTFPPDVIIVDAPGYGFAELPPAARQHWQALLLGYLASRRANLKAYILLDSRRFIRENDLDLIWILQRHEVEFAFVITKIDKLNKTEQTALQSQIAAQFGGNCQVFVTSAKSKQGIEELRHNL
ncbi:MAG: ribosome biogenesis GTP-binding protein YihA/YsxC [Holosporales bacterium]|jgi:GTP-binding protein|nr:ribosome biogenesis GTP-binding protein YihA/YsxC [Holosporales bacterium]